MMIITVGNIVVIITAAEASTCHGVLRGAELFSQFVHIVRVNLLIQSAAKPLWLGMVQHRCHRVRHVNDPASLRSNHKQESVRCLQDQVLELLQAQEGCVRNRGTTTHVCMFLYRTGYHPSHLHTDDANAVVWWWALRHPDNGCVNPKSPTLTQISPLCVWGLIHIGNTVGLSELLCVFAK